MNDSFGFIIIRLVASEGTNTLWKEAYKSIRNFYQEQILIVDDNSNQEIINNDKDKDKLVLKNTKIINGEFSKRGELLAYYYFYKLKPFNKAIILHDSVFINRYIDFSKLGNFQKLWTFKHDWNTPENEIQLIKAMKNKEKLASVYKDKTLWQGCFGMMTLISSDIIDKLQIEHNFPCGLLSVVDTRDKRMALERIVGLLQSIYGETPSLFGDIHTFIQSNYRLFGYDGWSCYFLPQYLSKQYLPSIPIVKVWSAR